MRDDGGRAAENLLSQSSADALISCPEKQLLRDTQWAQELAARNLIGSREFKNGQRGWKRRSKAGVHR